MRMDPSQRRSRSYSDMASTWRRHTLQLQTLGNKPSSLGTRGLPITTWRSTGLARASACLDAPLSVKGSQPEVQWRTMDWNLEMQSTMPCSFPLSGKNITSGQSPITTVAQEAQKAEESQPLKDMVPVQYCNFGAIFSNQPSNELPPYKAWDHAIHLTPGAALPHSC